MIERAEEGDRQHGQLDGEKERGRVSEREAEIDR